MQCLPVAIWCILMCNKREWKIACLSPIPLLVISWGFEQMKSCCYGVGQFDLVGDVSIHTFYFYLHQQSWRRLDFCLHVSMCLCGIRITEKVMNELLWNLLCTFVTSVLSKEINFEYPRECITLIWPWPKYCRFLNFRKPFVRRRSKFQIIKLAYENKMPDVTLTKLKLRTSDIPKSRT